MASDPTPVTGKKQTTSGRKQHITRSPEEMAKRIRELESELERIQKRMIDTWGSCD